MKKLLSYFTKTELTEKLEEVDGFKTLIVNINRENTNVVLGDTCTALYGDGYITDILCGVKIKLSPLSFYQVNRNGAELLYKKAAEYVAPTPDQTILDLYCGVGTIGLSMANKVGKLIGVEVIPAAVENANENARRNGVNNAEFICADAGEAASLLCSLGRKQNRKLKCINPRGGQEIDRRFFLLFLPLSVYGTLVKMPIFG